MTRVFRGCCFYAILTALSSGCGYVAVEGPPAIRPGAPVPTDVDCTSSSFAPFGDIVFAASFGGLYLDVVEDVNQWYWHTLFLSGIGAFFASAISGFKKMSDCRDFLETPVPADTTGLSRASPAIPSVFPLAREPAIPFPAQSPFAAHPVDVGKMGQRQLEGVRAPVSLPLGAQGVVQLMREREPR